MRCVNFDKCRNGTGGSQKKKCWIKWRMCGQCAIQYHPEEYSDMYVQRVLTQMRKKEQNGK